MSISRSFQILVIPHQHLLDLTHVHGVIVALRITLFDGFLIAGSPASKSSSQSTVAEVSVSSLGTIALIEDVPQTESEAIGAASSVIAVSDEGANAVNSLEMFLNGPSTISQGLYNMSGDRIA